MTDFYVSDEDQAKLDSGDYVIDPVFGVQPKTVKIQVRDYEASLKEAAQVQEPQEAPQTPAVAPQTPTTLTRADKNVTQP